MELGAGARIPPESAVGSNACRDGLATHAVVVPSQGSVGFLAGLALANGDVVVHHQGDQTDHRPWTWAVEPVLAGPVLELEIHESPGFRGERNQHEDEPGNQ